MAYRQGQRHIYMGLFTRYHATLAPLLHAYTRGTEQSSLLLVLTRMAETGNGTSFLYGNHHRLLSSASRPNNRLLLYDRRKGLDEKSPGNYPI